MKHAVVVAGRKVRYAVVGVGWISQGFFLPGAANTENSEVVAFVTGHEDKAKAVAAKWDIHEVCSYDEYAELLASGKIDAVYLATPNDDHVELAVQTLDAGIHLLLEKPMAVSVVECEQMIAAAERSGAKLMLAYRLHFEPGFLAALDIVRSGKLGEVRYFNSSFSQPVSGQNHRAKQGYWSGPVPDMGPYTINAARNFFGAEPVEVFATGVHSDPQKFNMHDTVAVTLKFPGERIAAMVLSYNALAVDDFRAVGTLGDIFSQPAYQLNVAMKHIVTIGEKKTESTCELTDHFGGETSYFSDCILKDRHPEADGEEGLMDVRVLEAVKRSLDTGLPQTLEPYIRKLRPTSAQVETLPKPKAPEIVGAHKPSDGQ